LVTARHKSLRQAALDLKITQPSLSMQLKGLEETLGVELFERSRGGVTLTPIGRDLMSEATQAVNAAESILDAANFAARGPSGTFRLGVTPSLGPYSLPFLLPAVKQAYRMIKFFVREAVSTELQAGLRNGTYDLILTTLPIEDPAFTVVPLIREPIYLVVNGEHPLTASTTITAEQLAGLNI